MTIKTAVKRDGTTQAYEPIKILRWVLWGSKGIEKAIDWQGLVQTVSSELYDGIDTQAIQLKVIEKCNSKRSSNYDLLAGRLYAAHIRKKLFNDKIPSLREHVRKLIDIGYMLDLGYSDEEYDEIDKIIDHDRDFTLKYSQVLQLYNKYALTNRVTGEKFETPQFVAMRMALALSAGEKDLMRTVRENYDMFSLFVGNAPTPNYTNLGTPHRGLISCCLYTTDDNAESLAVGDHIAYRMTCMSAGIGGYINTRSVGDPVKGGIVTHKGKMKYFKAVAAAVNANTQQCFHKDTEILTDRGFVKFTDLQDDSVVAQVHDDRSVSFTVPTARQIYPYNGPMYHIDNIDGNYELSVTPNHRLAWVRGDGYIDHTLANEFERDGQHFLTAVKAADAQPYTLSKEELLQLVNAMTVKTHRLSEGGMVHVLYSQQNKADYLYHTLSNLDLAYARSYSDEMCKVIFYEDIQPINLQNKTRQQLKAYLDTFYKLLGADIVAGAPPKLVNLMQSIAALCGIHTRRHVHTEDIEFISLTGLPAELPAKDTFTTITNVDSYVCCVTVPTGNVIVRYNGSVTVSGNSRGGACTSYFTCYDPEVIDLIHLQNPRTPVKKQIRDIHFAIEFNEFFYKKLLKKEDVFLFTSHSAPELHAAFFSPDTALFERLYNELENDPTFKKTYINSTKIAVAAGRQFHETATLYSANMTEFNRHTPFLEPIYSSNLCTAPETPILTKEYGYQAIQSLANQRVHVWNGEEWSPTQVVQTGTQQKLLTVTMSTGLSWDFTPYHKWYIDTPNGVVMKRTSELSPGDKLIKFDLQPCDHGLTSVERTKALPDNRYSIGYRVRCLSKVISDGGYITTVDDSVKTLALITKTKDVSRRLHLLLQELGVHSTIIEVQSKLNSPISVVDINADGEFSVCGESGLNDDDVFYLIAIGQDGVEKLTVIGFSVKNIAEIRTQGRSRDYIDDDKDIYSYDVTITGVQDNSRYDDTYCFTEPKRNMGMFGGVLCGNCTEIGQVTKPYKSIQDLYDAADLPGKGEISLCGLGGIVPSAIHQEPNFDKVHRETMAFTLQSDIEYFNVAYRQLKMISKCIRTNDYVFPHLKTTALNRMNAGVGMLGIAYDMAKRNFTYTSDEGIKFIHFLAERHAFMLIAASLKIGREEGNAPWINKTKWPQGWLPIDTYNKNVDTIADFQLHYPWEELRQAIIENGGIAHSCLITHMPTESCLDSATAIQTVNGPMTLKDIFELSGTTLEEAALAHEPILGGSWYDLKEPVRVLTRHGEKTVTRAWYNGQTPHAEITLESGEVIPATLGHDLLVKRDHGYSWVEVLDMRPGDVIATTSTPSTVVSVKLCDASTAHFIDIEVPDVHEYILASGVISHNSSKASGIPNAYYPVRDLHMLKTDGSNAIDFIVPEADEIGHQYQSAWVIPPLRQTQVTAVIQKFSDHSLSSDRYVDRDKMPELKASYLIDEILYDYIYGVKSRYYTNTKTTKGKKMTATTESFADEPEAGQDTSRGCDGGFCTL